MKKKKSDNKNIETGVAIGVVAALAAGAYFLYGTKDGEKNRKKVQGWMLKMKGEVLEKLEKIKDVNEDAYKTVVDEVSDKYKKMKKVDSAELLILATDLKKHWTKIKKDVQLAKKELKEDIPTPVKKSLSSAKKKSAKKSATGTSTKTNNRKKTKTRAVKKKSSQ